MKENSGTSFLLLLIIGLGIWFWHDHNSLKSNTSAVQQQLDEKVKTQNSVSSQALKLQSCLDLADINYNVLFTKDCKLNGNFDCDANPTLPLSTISFLQKDRDSTKDICFKQFPPVNNL